MQRIVLARRYFSIPDLAILMLIATVIYTIVSLGHEWRAEFHPLTQIDLSASALPYYVLLSASRGLTAYLISLIFTLFVGYVAAKSRLAEKIIIPLLDILQSIPVLGFLPGLLLGLVALFPNTNTGLELAAILMIFTGQVWNMTFSFYASLKALPSEYKEAATVMGLPRRQRLLKLELPFSAVNLAWNSLLSMAGGWFFLIPCEAITLGDREYRLPGIGAYMDVAIKQNDYRAIALAVAAMVTLIVMMDFVIWRPILAWVQRFRLESTAGVGNDTPLMQIWIRESKIVRWIKLRYRDYLFHYRRQKSLRLKSKASVEDFGREKVPLFQQATHRIINRYSSHWVVKVIEFAGSVLIGIGLMWGAVKLFGVLIQVPISTWVVLLRNSIWTLGRVVMALLLSTLWAVPAGIWIGTSPRRTRIAQPLIQVLASFPAPMLYPLMLSLFFACGISFDWGSMFLMMLGVQWYVLFNVLAGALRIPRELNDALSLMESSLWNRWKTLYLPSVFPSLVTGWVTAAGGAWNASVVAEYLSFEGKILKTGGLGASLNVATASENFKLFAASLTLMVIIVVALNRLVWSRIHELAQTRFKMDL